MGKLVVQHFFGSNRMALFSTKDIDIKPDYLCFEVLVCDREPCLHNGALVQVPKRKLNKK